jgi:hypothetical protein
MTDTRETKPSLVKDGGAQMRVEKINPETVNDYASDMLNGAVLPAIVVCFDGTDYWLGDGSQMDFYNAWKEGGEEDAG